MTKKPWYVIQLTITIAKGLKQENRMPFSFYLHWELADPVSQHSTPKYCLEGAGLLGLPTPVSTGKTTISAHIPRTTKEQPGKRSFLFLSASQN